MASGFENELFTGELSRKAREQMNGHSAGVIWLTGLPGSGKTTLALLLAKKLLRLGCQVAVLDGDDFRRRLCRDLGFSKEARKENIRRAGEVARMFYENGFIVICSFVSPFQEDRDFVRALIEDGKFFEIYLKCRVEICEQRDPKGNYARAKRGEITEFTGISSPYEQPFEPELILDSELLGPEALSEKIQSLFVSCTGGAAANVLP